MLGQSEGSLHPGGGNQLFICLLNINRDGRNVLHNEQPEMDHLSSSLFICAAGGGDSAPPATTQPACCRAGERCCSATRRQGHCASLLQLFPKSKAPAELSGVKPRAWVVVRALGRLSLVSWAPSSAPRLDFSGNPDYSHLISLCSRFLHAMSTWAHPTSARGQAAVVGGFDEAGRKNQR